MGSFSHVAVLLTLCSVLQCSCTEESYSRHNINQITWEIMKANPGKNLALSPFLFRFPLCKLSAIAIGGAKQELMTVLQFNTSEEIKFCFTNVHADIGRLMETDMTLLNMMFVNYTDNISDQFISDASNFGVVVSKIGFDYPAAAVKFVNDMFDSKTYKRIREVLELNDVNSSSSILIVNGLHFKASWENSFKVKRTTNTKFHGNNKTLKVPMMNGIQQCLYLDDEVERFKVISLKLANYGVSMMFVLPDISVPMDRLLLKLIETPGALQKIRHRLNWDNVNVFLPRFKIKTCLDWTEYFRQFGLERTTNRSSSDLNAILIKPETNMYLSKAKQRVFLDIDEMGTHRQDLRDEFDLRNQEESRELPASAYETVHEFVADRPFLFFISMMTQRSTDFEVISGIYNGPE